MKVKSKSCYRVVIETKDRDGKVLKRIEKQGDALTLNFAKLLAMILVGTEELNTKNYANFIEYGGSSETLIIGYSGYNFCYEECYEGYIEIGTGTSPPKPTDYKLENLVKREYVKTINIIYGDNYIEVAISGSITVNTEMDINEIGLTIRAQNNSGYLRYFLLARDVLPSPVHVTTGQTVTITYIFRFEW